MTQTQQMTGEDLFEAHFKALEPGLGNAPAWQRELREAGMARFREMGLPTARQEEWRHTNIDPLREAALAAEATAPAADAVARGLAEYGIPQLGGARLVFVNGRFAAEHSDLTGLPEGAVARSLAEALAEGDGAALEPYLGHIVGEQEGALAALNRAMFSDGLFLSIPAETKIERPIHLLYLNGAGETPAAMHPRNLLMIGAGAHAVMVESYIGLDDSTYLVNSVSEVEMGENAFFDHYKLQRESRAAFHFQTLAVHQHAGGKFDTHALTEGGRLGRNDITATIDGEGCDTILNGLYMLAGDQLFDTHTLLDHARPHCHSREIYKGILADKARAVFRGKILVRQYAQKTDAVQSSKNLLISPTAQVNAQPQLEIYADDVKCTHGATVGQLNREAIFYAQSRGLSRADALAMLTFAFANDNLVEVADPTVREHLEGLIHRWLAAHGTVEETS